MSEPTRDSFAMYVESAHHAEGDTAFLREMLAAYDALTQRAEAAEAERGADTHSDCVFCATRIYGKMIGAGDGTGQKFAHPECYYLTRLNVAEAERDALRKLTPEKEAAFAAAFYESERRGGIDFRWGQGFYDGLKAALAVQPTTVEAEPVVESKPRTCNLHDDCDAADQKAREKGRNWADHCDDEYCEDCFGS